MSERPADASILSLAETDELIWTVPRKGKAVDRLFLATALADIPNGRNDATGAVANKASTEVGCIV